MSRKRQEKRWKRRVDRYTTGQYEDEEFEAMAIDWEYSRLTPYQQEVNKPLYLRAMSMAYAAEQYRLARDYERSEVSHLQHFINTHG